jgi:hypothetical protein
VRGGLSVLSGAWSVPDRSVAYLGHCAVPVATTTDLVGTTSVTGGPSLPSGGGT